jgi:putative ABC transport system permease protein
MMHLHILSALRHFRRYKLTTLINVLCLALGFACFALAYSSVRYFTQADRYHALASRTFVITQQSVFPGSSNVVTLPITTWVLAPHLRADFPELERVARASRGEETAVAVDGKKDFAQVSYADPEFLEIFDLQFLAGDRRRALSGPHSAVVTQDLAQRLFGTTNAIGRSLLLNNRETVNITGVIAAPRQPSHMSEERSSAPLNFSALVSMDTLQALVSVLGPDVVRSRFEGWTYNNNYYTYVTLAETGSFRLSQLRASLDGFARRHIPKDQGTARFDVQPIWNVNALNLNVLMQTDRVGLSSTLLILLLGGLVLFVSCLNYANLAAAQAATRLKELALRRVIGAGRGQIIAQTLVEALLLSAAAALIGLVLVLLMQPALRAAMQLEMRELLFASPAFWGGALAVIVAVSVVAAAYPALISVRVQPVQALRSGRVRGRSLAATLLVGIQFAAASFLMITVFVVEGQNQELRQTAERMSADPIVVITNNFKQAGIDLTVMQDELRNQPGVLAVGASQYPPGSISSGFSFVAAGPAASSRRWMVSSSSVDYGFLDTIGLKLLAGRGFDKQYGSDATLTPPGETEPKRGNVIIDRALARQYGWENPRDAIGQQIYLSSSMELNAQRQPITVIGVVEEQAIYPLGIGATSSMYWLSPERLYTMVVRISRNETAAALRAIDTAWDRLAPNIPLKRRFLDEQMERTYRTFTIVTAIFGVLAVFALLISIMGLTGMAIHASNRRIHEIGVRKTLGASVRQVVVLLLKDFSKPVVIANLVAWPLGFLAAQLYLSLFVNRTGLSLVPFVASLLLTLAVAWLAVLWQTLRAARVNPAHVLRYE